ncbi:MAG: hypothetical protein NTX25_00405, partial [Proteobacteria bacterium]|nr:hypothetical protein [Pseudomonadota bacterium]
ACGGGSGGGSGTPAIAPNNMKLISSKADIICDANAKNFIFYVSVDTKFYLCDGSALSEIDIKGKDGIAGTNGAAGTNGTNGLTISEIWRFHTATYSGAQDVCTESSTSCYLGTIQLTKFSDGSAFFSAMGLMSRFDSSAADSYYENFSHQSFIASSTSEQSLIFKFDIYANSTVLYKVTLAATPLFKATVDVDGNYGNNTDFTFTLTKQ